eukprot:1226860-Pyramimonas_sp.AAC.1
MGEVTFFYKGSGPPQVAKAQRNITMASTICKLDHRHIRSLALDFFTTVSYTHLRAHETGAYL